MTHDGSSNKPTILTATETATITGSLMAEGNKRKRGGYDDYRQPDRTSSISDSIHACMLIKRLHQQQAMTPPPVLS